MSSFLTLRSKWKKGMRKNRALIFQDLLCRATSQLSNFFVNSFPNNYFSPVGRFFNVKTFLAKGKIKSREEILLMDPFPRMHMSYVQFSLTLFQGEREKKYIIFSVDYHNAISLMLFIKLFTRFFTCDIFQMTEITINSWYYVLAYYCYLAFCDAKYLSK